MPKASATDAAIQAAIDGELRLLEAEVRASPELVAEFLDSDFVEFGASGRRWDAQSILAVMGPDNSTPESPIVATEISGVLLAPGIVHLTYVSEHDGRRARRSSLWRLTDAGWRVYFHQGTLID
ncbi:MAG: DUF4440 domain-containing protein [Catenulisporales bacterium]|nr:DUF4440 domain-containing protein [Catenulisporales bacterium]